MSESKENFDWKGEGGDKYALWNPSDVAGTDKTWVEYYGRSATDLLSAATATLKKEGLQMDHASVLDIGCSTGKTPKGLA